MRRGLLRIVLHGSIQVLQLVVPELLEEVAQGLQGLVGRCRLGGGRSGEGLAVCFVRGESCRR